MGKKEKRKEKAAAKELHFKVLEKRVGDLDKRTKDTNYELDCNHLTGGQTLGLVVVASVILGILFIVALAIHSGGSQHTPSEEYMCDLLGMDYDIVGGQGGCILSINETTGEAHFTYPITALVNLIQTITEHETVCECADYETIEHEMLAREWCEETIETNLEDKFGYDLACGDGVCAPINARYLQFSIEEYCASIYNRTDVHIWDERICKPGKNRCVWVT